MEFMWEDDYCTHIKHGQRYGVTKQSIIQKFKITCGLFQQNASTSNLYNMTRYTIGQILYIQ